MRGHSDRVYACAVTPDGAVAVTASRDKTARVWNMRTGRLQRVLLGHTDFVWNCSISADGMFVATASRDGTVRVWRTADGKEVCELRQVGYKSATGCALTPDGRTLVATFKKARSSAGAIVRCDWQGRGVRAQHTRNGTDLNNCTVSSDGTVALCVWWKRGADSVVELLDTLTGRSLQKWSSSRNIHRNNVAMSAAGDRVVIADGTQLQVFAAPSNPTTRWTGVVLTGYNPPSRAAFTPDGKLVIACATVNNRQAFGVWNAETGAMIAKLAAAESGRLFACAITQDGATAIGGDANGVVYAWNVALALAMFVRLPHLAIRRSSTPLDVLPVRKYGAGDIARARRQSLHVSCDESDAQVCSSTFLELLSLLSVHLLSLVCLWNRLPSCFIIPNLRFRGLPPSKQ
jgi:WD40 repeat protein